MRLSHKIYLAIGAAIVVGSASLATNYLTDRLITSQAATLREISELEVMEQRLDAHIVSAAYQLYYDYDAILGLIGRLNGRIESLRSDPYLDLATFADSLVLLGQYQTQLAEKAVQIEQFNTINSLIKNSTTLIPTLSYRYLSRYGVREPDFFREVSEITSLIFLASRSLDEEMLRVLDEKVVSLEGRAFDDDRDRRFNRTFLTHARIFLTNQPIYSRALQQALSVPTGETLQRLAEGFDQTGKRLAGRIAVVNHALSLLFIATIGVIIWFLLRVDKEHKALILLHNRLKENAATDHLTRLRNRFAFERDHATALAGTALFLVNIDRFRDINDFYGADVGDAVLKQVAGNLVAQFGGLPQVRIYRLGADEFGILVAPGTAGCDRVAAQLIEGTASTGFTFQGQGIPINLSIALSREEPLLEKADLTLRLVKRCPERYLEYSPGLGLEQTSAHNLRIIRCLAEAIPARRVVPYFQPIHDNRSGRVDCYECLMRVVDAEGGLLHPHEFFEIARRGHLWSGIVRLMIDRSMEVMVDSGHNFSLNLSLADIADPAVTDHLFAHLNGHPGLGGRLILELSAEEVQGEQGQIAGFVRAAKAHGCRIALDDLGGGHANFHHLLSLEIDNIKIDGALIRDIDDNPKAEALVRNIVRFAREIPGVTTTAEYVHSQAVLDRVCELGIDYSQGYHLGRPAPQLLGSIDLGEI